MEAVGFRNQERTLEPDLVMWQLYVCRFGCDPLEVLCQELAKRLDKEADQLAVTCQNPSARDIIVKILGMVTQDLIEHAHDSNYIGRVYS